MMKYKNSTIVEEYALRDSEGNIKSEVKDMVYQNLKIKAIPKKLLPGYFHGRLSAGDDKKLGDFTIQQLLDGGYDGFKKIMDSSSLPVLKAYDKFLVLADQEVDGYFVSYINQSPIPLLSTEYHDQDLLSLVSKFNLELNEFADRGYFDDKSKRSIKLFSTYFEGKSIEEIATKYNMSTERARQIIKIVGVHSKILKEESNFYLAQNFKDALESYKLRYINNDLITNFLEEESVLFQAESNKLNFLGFDLIRIQLNNQSRYFLTDKELVSIRTYINAFIQFSKNSFFEKNSENYYEEFKDYYKEETKKKYQENLANDKILFNQILQSSFIQSRFSEEFDENLYSIDWNLLASMDLKIAKILYDNESQMTQDEILKEYNDRCEYYGEDLLETTSSLHMGRTRYIKNIRNGVWVYSEEEIDNSENTQSIISKFLISKNGVATYDEIEFQLHERGLKYPANSLRAFILMVATTAKNDRNLFAHKDYLDKVDFEVSSKRDSMMGAKVLPIIKEQLLTLIADISIKAFTIMVKDIVVARGISNNRNINVQYYIDLLATADALNIDNGVILFMSLDKDKIEQVKYRDEPAYREAIRNEAVVLLKDSGNIPILATEFWKKLSHLYPQDLSKNNFYKIFDKSVLFIKEAVSNNRILYSLDAKYLPKPQPFTEVAVNPSDLDLSVTPENSSRSVFNDVQDHSWTEESLFTFIKKDLSFKYGVNNWDFEYGFERFKSILTGTENSSTRDSVWGESILKSLGRVLMNMSDFFDRDTCMQRLSLSFESYLKILMNDNTAIGLGTIIREDSTLRALKEYKNLYFRQESNATLLDFSKKLNSLLYFRNLYAHDPNSEKVNISLVDHVKNIMDFISLYIFVAATFKDIETR